MAVELRDLRAFLAVIRTGSFTAAAAELGYTQSAVSQQVGALEAELGRPLLHRRPVHPTEAGAHLAEHASRILLRLDVARSEIEQLDHDDLYLRVTATPLAARGLGAALRAVRAGHRSLQITVRTGGVDEAIGDLAAGRSEVAVIDGIVSPESPLALGDAGLLRAVPLTESPLAVILPRDHPLATRASLDLASVLDAPWIDAPQLLTVADPVRDRRRVPAALRYDGRDLRTLLELVGAGHGSVVLPAWVAPGPAPRPATGDVVAVPLGRPALVHRVEVLRLRTAAQLARSLVDSLRQSLRPESPDPPGPS